MKILRACIWSIMRYACEIWELNKSTKKRIIDFEIWRYKRILKISWIGRITNEEVLRRMKRDRPMLLNQIKKRQRKYLGHILRGSASDKLKDIVTVAAIRRNTSRGHKRTTWRAGAKQPTKKLSKLIHDS